MNKAGQMNFQELTGRGVKVAIVDSGIDSEHLDIKDVAGGVCIRLDDKMNPVFSKMPRISSGYR